MKVTSKQKQITFVPESKIDAFWLGMVVAKTEFIHTLTIGDDEMISMSISVDDCMRAFLKSPKEKK